MNKRMFLETLRKELRSLSSDDLNDIIENYEEQIENQISQGKPEYEVISNLEDPKLIAREVLSELGYEHSAESTIIENNIVTNTVPKSILLSIMLIFFNVVFVLGPVLGIFGALVGIIGAGVGLTLGAIFTPYNVDFIGMQPNIWQLFFVIGIGILIFNGGVWLFIQFYKLISRYVRWNISIIRGA